MNKTVTHDRKEENIEAKVRWLRSLPLSERMDMLCAFTDLALTLNPDLSDKKNAQQLDDLLASKKAAGRDIDLEDVRLLELSADNYFS